MTQFSPSLIIRRLVVLKSGGKLYDQVFQPGLNIIRGENSSGKSTIADLIFFSLGGDLQNWTPEAGTIDSVHTEVKINGTVYTLSRDVEPGFRPPLYLFEGHLDTAMNDREKWLRYPYARSNNTESFSQLLFGLLGFPEQKTEAHQNITIHQILRLLYFDQITPVDEIFRSERFDNRDIRTAVGELLLGVDDLEMHDIRLRLRESEKRYVEIAGELRSMFNVLGQTDHADISVVNYQDQIKQTREEQEKLRNAINELTIRRAEDVAAEADERTRKLYETLKETKARIGEERRKEQTITFDLEDSAHFVKTLRERLNALSASEHMMSILGDITFQMCPACFQVVDNNQDSSLCHLCKHPISDSEPQAGYLKMREELTFQVRESGKLIQRRDTELASIRASLSSLNENRRTLEEQLTVLERSVYAADAEIELRVQRIGYLDRLIEDLNTRAELAEIIGRRISLRDELGVEIASLKDELEAKIAVREKRTKEVRTRISELCVETLHRDLPQEETFQIAEVVEFDFAANKMWANDRARFSASSMTLLKNSVIFSLMRLSLEDVKVRWPRFLLLDNIEDKGMQPERSANFQELIEEMLSDVDVEHQVILTTSMISPKLDGSPYCIGPYYNNKSKSLAFHQK